jgi:hypothetical protein
VVTCNQPSPPHATASLVRSRRPALACRRGHGRALRVGTKKTRPAVPPGAGRLQSVNVEVPVDPRGRGRGGPVRVEKLGGFGRRCVGVMFFRELLGLRLRSRQFFVITCPLVLGCLASPPVSLCLNRIRDHRQQIIRFSGDARPLTTTMPRQRVFSRSRRDDASARESPPPVTEAGFKVAPPASDYRRGFAGEEMKKPREIPRKGQST